MPNDGRFTDINVGFSCFQCGRDVLPAETTCRNHCPFCLFSKHVDVYPGDRAATCGGPMAPVSYERSSKKGIVIIHRCGICGHEQKNKAALKDKYQADSMDEIFKLGAWN